METKKKKRRRKRPKKKKKKKRRKKQSSVKTFKTQLPMVSVPPFLYNAENILNLFSYDSSVFSDVITNTTLTILFSWLL